jgi:uncharacterized protein YpmB
MRTVISLLVVIIVLLATGVGLYWERITEQREKQREAAELIEQQAVQSQHEADLAASLKAQQEAQDEKNKADAAAVDAEAEKERLAENQLALDKEKKKQERRAKYIADEMANPNMTDDQREALKAKYEADEQAIDDGQ